MSRRYDSGTTTFSPDGRLFQVEYAIEAINNSASALGIVCTDGIVIAAEKRETGKLLMPSKSSDKVFKIDAHVACAVAGIQADANLLTDHLRLSAARHRYTYDESIPVEALMKRLCDIKQSITQMGGALRGGCGVLLLLLLARSARARMHVRTTRSPLPPSLTLTHSLSFSLSRLVCPPPYIPRIPTFRHAAVRCGLPFCWVRSALRLPSIRL